MRTGELSEGYKPNGRRGEILAKESDGGGFANPVEIGLAEFVEGSGKEDRFGVGNLDEAGYRITMMAGNTIELSEGFPVSILAGCNELAPDIGGGDAIGGYGPNGGTILKPARRGAVEFVFLHCPAPNLTGHLMRASEEASARDNRC
tara:strand:+ start:216 stop:656 length:441 start_codon:yes stop_codon:yes gene_type:complete